MILASIPSPSRGVVHLGPFPLRGYALMIILGVIAAVLIGERRYQARGGEKGVVTDVATLAVPFGLVGGRLYHVISSPQAYFGKGGDPVAALYIWRGGLGIWGAIALGALGAWLALRRRGLPLAPLADAVAPGLAVAQAIGRWGNWFNQELYGRATDLPWALHITHPAQGGVPGYYHPTFLYECLWDLGVAGLVIWADRRWRLGHFRALALYVAAYTVGRAWIEALRIDPANHILGLRLNDWTSLVVFLGAVGYLLARRGSGRESPEEVRGVPAEAPSAAAEAPAGERRTLDA